jgi:hypothetical protein
MMAVLLENGLPRGNAETQLLVFMWCRGVDIGAHHACWLLLQAPFITASAPTATSKTATRTMTKGLFIVTSRPRPFPKSHFGGLKMNPQ